MADDLGIAGDDRAGRYEPGQVLAAEGGEEGIRRGEQDGDRLFGWLDARPTSQWSRLAAGRDDDLGATAPTGSEHRCCH
ncbi:hypothetical protein [Micromonospora sp. NPDC005305]|uniref:hypothetical protein n=1 Tax=Micromonospora sp. NPDC005305 TaxID=3156875 RepID=UPI0033AE9BED